MLRNLATSLVLYEQIDTTLAKGKELKSYLDKILARNKEADLTTIKELNKIFFDNNAVKKIIEELIPRYKDRTCGFIKSYRLKNRLGDNSPMIRLVLVDKMKFVDANTETKKAEPKETPKASTKAKSSVKKSKTKESESNDK